MTRSVHVLGSRQFGGADRFYVRLIRALNAHGHRAVAVNRRDSPVARALAERGLPQYHLPLANKWDVYSVVRLRAIVRAERPDAVQTYMGRATRLTRLPPQLGVPHIARLGGYYKLDGYYRHCDAWVGNTRGIRDYLVSSGLPPDRVRHIGNFVPVARPSTAEERAVRRQSLGIPEAASVLFALGRFVEKKGFGDLLDAFSRLPVPAAGVAPHLVIVGDGPLGVALRERARTLGVSDRVHWGGWQNDPDPWFAAGDVLVCPSRHEPLGNVILEGWNHGLPVVSTATQGATELITDGVNGLLTPCGEPGSLAEALQRFMGMGADERCKLVSNGGRTLQDEYGEASVVSAYANLYRELALSVRSCRAQV